MFGLMVLYMLRVNLSIAIVCMVTDDVTEYNNNVTIVIANNTNVTFVTSNHSSSGTEFGDTCGILQQRKRFTASVSNMTKLSSVHNCV